MYSRRVVPSLLALAATAVRAQDSTAFSSLGGCGTLQSGGVVATIGGDASGKASAALEWCVAGVGTFRADHPLMRVDATHFVGSLPWLDPGKTHEARGAVSDAGGADATSVRTATFSTRAEAGAFVPPRTLHVATTEPTSVRIGRKDGTRCSDDTSRMCAASHSGDPL